MAYNNSKGKITKGADFAIFLATLILLGVGLVMVFSASYITSLESRGDAFFFLRRQAFWIILGLGGLLFLANFPYRKLRSLAPLLLVINFGLLLAVFIPGLGVEINEARRWLGVGAITIQPAEFTKLALIVFTADFISRRSDRLRDFWHTSFIPLLVMAFSFALIIKQPDLGTALAIGAVVAIMLFAAGMPIPQLFALGGLALPAMLYLMFSEEYRTRRLLSFLDPWADPLRTGYHIIQSLYALGPGGVFGVGLGRSRQKLYYLPEPQNDFIFAIIGEELGFIGAVTVILLFFTLIWRGFKTAIFAPDTFGSLLAAGITGLIATQTLINIGVVTGSIPITGINLPLISAGGSSLFFTLCEIGILLNISKHTR